MWTDITGSPFAVCAVCAFTTLFAQPQAGSQNASANPQETKQVKPLADRSQTAPDGKPGITLRTTTTLVHVRVIAHHANGDTVTNLKKEDFEVFDNGAKQQIAEFAIETASPKAAGQKGASPAAFPDDTRPEPDGGGYAVVLLDYLNSGITPGMRGRVEVERLLKSFDPAGRAALYALNEDGIANLGDFGTDREALLAKIGTLIGHPSPCPDKPGMDGEALSSLNRCEEGVSFFLYQRDLKTINMLEGFADRLSFVPGRKALIWVTSGSDVHEVSPLISKSTPKRAMADYPLARMPKLEARFENAIRKLNNADVGLYTVDICAINECYAHTDMLEDFAKRTGGRAFRGTNDLAGAMREAVEDVRTVYSLAFYAPPDVDLEKFHQLKVQVNRPGIKLTYRQGYSLGTAIPAGALVKELPGAEARALRAKAFAPTSIFKELESLVAIPAAGNFGATLSAPYFYTGANVAIVDLSLEMSLKGMRGSELNLAAEAVRPDGTVAAKFTDTVKLKFATDAEAEAFVRHPYRYRHQFRLAAGQYDVRVAFGSEDTGLGRAEAPLTVDGWDGKALAVSAVALARETRKADTGSAALDGRKALVSRSVEVLPAGNNRFHRGEPCKAYFEIYSGANAAKMSVQLRVSDRESGASKVDSGAFPVDGLAKPGESMVPVSFTVPVDLLAPGKYKLEVKAMPIGADAVTRIVEFEVE